MPFRNSEFRGDCVEVVGLAGADKLYIFGGTGVPSARFGKLNAAVPCQFGIRVVQNESKLELVAGVTFWVTFCFGAQQAQMT